MPLVRHDGVYTYLDLKLVPAWGGSMFEALMPDLFIPEAEWDADSWAINHTAAVRAQIEHGLDDAGYGYWGFSPASDPFAEYREYGVEAIGISSDGYASDVERTNVAPDMTDAARRPTPHPTSATAWSLRTPPSSLPYAKDAVLENLDGLRDQLGAFGPGGFYDSVAVGSGTIADRYLSLDQSMIMGAIGNELKRDRLKTYFVDDAFEEAVRPLVEALEFGSELPE